MTMTFFPMGDVDLQDDSLDSLLADAATELSPDHPALALAIQKAREHVRGHAVDPNACPKCGEPNRYHHGEA